MNTTLIAMRNAQTICSTKSSIRLTALQTKSNYTIKIVSFAIKINKLRCVFDDPQSAYKNSTIENTALVSPHDSIPGLFHVGDSVVAVIWSNATPTITIESKGTSRVFSGSPSDSLIYRIIIPSTALADTNILTINSQWNYSGSLNPMDPCPASQNPLSHRQVLVRDYKVGIAVARQTAVAAAHPRFQNNRLLLPPGTAWRVIDTRGRQVAFIKPETRQWVPSPGLAHMQLFLIPIKGQLQRPMRFVIGN
jgi:hypothetical protein